MQVQSSVWPLQSNCFPIHTGVDRLLTMRTLVWISIRPLGGSSSDVSKKRQHCARRLFLEDIGKEAGHLIFLHPVAQELA